MTEWSLTELFSSLHVKIDEELKIAKEALRHPGTKGDASEKIWIELLKTYLPKRYRVCSAHVVDSNGSFSDQIDVVIFDRQYSPFIFDFMGAKVVPVESVYAVFEAKQTINAAHIRYAKDKVASVRNLVRTSLPIPTASGVVDPKEPQPIVGGILTFESDWNPALGKPLVASIAEDSSAINHLDLGCVSSHGVFRRVEGGELEILTSKSATTRFLFDLISLLQTKATVPMIDIGAYGKWLTD